MYSMYIYRHNNYFVASRLFRHKKTKFLLKEKITSQVFFLFGKEITF